MVSVDLTEHRLQTGRQSWWRHQQPALRHLFLGPKHPVARCAVSVGPRPNEYPRHRPFAMQTLLRVLRHWAAKKANGGVTNVTLGKIAGLWPHNSAHTIQIQVSFMSFGREGDLVKWALWRVSFLIFLLNFTVRNHLNDVFKVFSMLISMSQWHSDIFTAVGPGPDRRRRGTGGTSCRWLNQKKRPARGWRGENDLGVHQKHPKTNDFGCNLIYLDVDLMFYCVLMLMLIDFVWKWTGKPCFDI